MAVTAEQAADLSRAHTRPAADVKNRWRDIVEDAKAYGEVVVTNHNRPEVVVLSVENYVELLHRAETNDPLTALRAEWDRQMAVLQEAPARDNVGAFMSATPEEIAGAANRGRNS